jgi:hypothetical protein
MIDKMIVTIRPDFHPCRTIFILLLIAALYCTGCSKPHPEAPTTPSPAKAAAPSPASTRVAQPTEVSAAVVNILNKAHRSGSAILRGECGSSGTIPLPQLSPPVMLEPMEQALQAISGQYQNIYWRESRTNGVVVADSTVPAKLLRVHVREFRVVEDREPDAVLSVLWREPEVAAFLRKNHIRFARRITTANKAISPPMIVGIKNATVGEILDRIAAAYHSDPPKVWIYSECGDKQNMTIDVRIK